MYKIINSDLFLLIYLTWKGKWKFYNFFLCLYYVKHKAKYNTQHYYLESELVSGFMTEHAAVIFVFFFLAEYASIVLICILTSILFLGGYLYFTIPLFTLVQHFNFDYYINNLHKESIFSDPILEGLLYGLTLGVKTCIMIFVFIWARVSFPRIRFDQLMSFCWTILLPIVIAFVILVPCILYGFEIIPANSFLI